MGDKGDPMKVNTIVRGRPQPPSQSTTYKLPQVFCDDATAILDALDLKSYSVIGEGGLGTRTALHVAVTRPREVRQPSPCELVAGLAESIVLGYEDYNQQP